ncbi:MAG: hypothetical protein EKK48_00960 [Candidatus Melainabacteria bacterium]|nr:MAG: hypothetical protein EKK48_00960 [Candidatus Melainabacteria bacterium]
MSSLDNEPVNVPGNPMPRPQSGPQNMVNLVIQRLLRDKILLGLIIVGVLTIFVGVAFTGDDPKDPNKATPLATAGPQGAGQGLQAPGAVGTPTAATPAQPAGLTPELATKFVTWWLSKSMDYSMATGKASHQEAFGWMTPQTVQAFQTGYWTPEIENAVVTGKVTAAFQPVSVQAQFINPDGSIVVAMTGALVMQQAGTQTATQQLSADFLVKQETEGLRIVGINIHPAPPTTAAPY